MSLNEAVSDFKEIRPNYKLNSGLLPPFYSDLKKGVKYDISQVGLPLLLLG
jgi:hypothetical protein